MRTPHLVVAMSLLVLSCEDSGTSPMDGPAAVTDRSDYLVGETIRLGFRNNGSDPLLLASCCTSVALYVDSWENGTWQQVEARGLPCFMLCPSIEFVVAPAHTFLDSLSIQNEGTFRLRIPFAERGQGSFKNEVVTNSFMVRIYR
jgi:hypothetical protein